MTKLLILISRFIGVIAGYVSAVVWPTRLSYPAIVASRAFHTIRQKRRFKTFGKGSYVAADCFIAGKGTMSVGDGSAVQPHSVIETCGRESVIEVGNYVSLGEFCHITALKSVVIGDGTLTGRFVLISDNSHGFTDGSDLHLTPLSREVTSRGGIKIGRNVWIGDKATILQGVTVGDNAIIAANAVVTKSIPENAVAAGNPARMIKIMKK